MEKPNKVFCSEIITTSPRPKNNLYDLIKVEPAKALEIKDVKIYTCDFIPRTDKIYVPKRTLRPKVKTVRDIRTSFENDTYAYLTRDLETQQNYLLKKIRGGSSRNENTLNIAKKILKSDSPISRSTFQMLLNLNSDHRKYPRQFVLYKGKFIQVNGSKGGDNKLICKYDLANAKIQRKVKNETLKIKKDNKKKGLLRNSLTIKFKPGPLGRKKFLDDSHQKYHGDIELVDLPKVGLVVQPTYGTLIEPTISNFLSNLGKEDGVISEKWAEFAVSVLGKIHKSNAKLLSEDSVTFDLKYKCDQHRILMRKDLDTLYGTPSVADRTTDNKNICKAQRDILPEVEDMMNKILDAVEINIIQDTMFTVDKSLIQNTSKVSNPVDVVTLSKDKTKRKYSELDRLDVTVIRIPEKPEKECTYSCGNMYCLLGCICDSIRNTYHFKQHCGREECMFNCKCDFSKYRNINFLDINDSDSTELIPGIINIEDQINTRLAKEEQKFHQTVIVTGEKNILLKSEKRNWKSSKKHGTFYKNMCLKNVNHENRILSITALRLNCENVEPWCMVHNLYKCFCKGKFTTSNASDILPCVSKESISQDIERDVDCPPEKIQKLNNTYLPAKPRLRRHDAVSLDRTLRKDSEKASDITTKPLKIKRNESDTSGNNQKSLRSTSEASYSFRNKHKEDVIASDSSDPYDSFYSDYNGTCSRVIGYEGRKFTDGHYQVINYKIKKMEKNDKMLQKKIMSILNPDVENNTLLEEKQTEEKDIEKQTILTDSGNVQHKENTRNQSIQKDITLPETAIDPLTETTKDTPTERAKDPPTEPAKDHNLFKFLYDINGDDCGGESKKRLLPSEHKLVRWLESNYKLYKQRIDEGLVKSSLEAPRVGKIALHSWNFILSRYRERKNIFLISKQKPYRIFMGVHTRNQFFETCININEIRFADLHKYPQKVKNLLTNATDLKDNFCILRGLTHCWELVGSVAKVNNTDDNAEDINDAISDANANLPSHSIVESEGPNDQSMYLNDDDSNYEYPTEAESSKWFVMTLENDFTEIRFYKKGFFVKYDSIVKAINVARMSGKTVRLSSQKCVEKSSSPQFGIYAIPNASEYCVFIGPYEIDDSLGIETIKSISDVGKIKRTRGFWITTNKVDNLRVIDNPLSFIPLSDLKKNEAVPLENHFCEDRRLSETDSRDILHLKEVDESQQKTLLKLDFKKVIKPIKIRKTNGFYHLASASLLKKVALQSPHKMIIRPTATVNAGQLINKSLSKASSDTLGTEAAVNIENPSNSPTKAVNMELDSQIQISAVYSQRDEQNLNNNKNERGMFILKPEEINRLFESQINSETLLSETSSPKSSEYPLVEEIDLETSTTLTTCTTNEDIYIISDDESETNDDDDDGEERNRWKPVLIMCTDVSDLGWVWGRQNYETLSLSFKLQGDEYSDFYTEDNALKELNRELTKIIGPSKPFDLNWKIVDSLDVLETEVTPLNFNRLAEIFKRQDNESFETRMPVHASSNIRTYSKNSASKSRASLAAESKKVYKPSTRTEGIEAIELLD